MKIYLGADHRGFTLKNQLKGWLEKEGYAVTDLGPTANDPADDYPDYGIPAAKAVAEQPEDTRGILLCGSGVGMAVLANKVPGVRAAVIHDPAQAAMARRDDNTNVIALGADWLTFDQATAVLRAWLAEPFSNQERHRRRLAKIAQLERPLG